MTDIKKVTKITVRKELVLSESDLEELMFEHGMAKFGVPEDQIEVHFEVRHDIIQSVTIAYERTSIEEE